MTTGIAHCVEDCEGVSSHVMSIASFAAATCGCAHGEHHSAKAVLTTQVSAAGQAIDLHLT